MTENMATKQKCNHNKSDRTMKDNTKRYFFLWLAIFFVGIGLVFADSVVILLGDVNRDGEVNVADITAITNYVHGQTEGCDATAADVNRDNDHDVADITGIINIVHYGTPSGDGETSVLFFTGDDTVEKTYGDEDFSKTIVRAGSTATITYASSNPSVATVADDGTVTIVGGGTATITATLPADGSFNVATASYTLTVAKATAPDLVSTMTVDVTAKKDGSDNQTYTGDALDLVNAGESKAGTLKYKVTTTNEQPAKDSGGWSESVPTETNAGTYYVWYYAEGNDNYEETAVSSTPIEVTIDEATPTVGTAPEFVSSDLAYTGSPQALATTASDVIGGTVKYFVNTTGEAPTVSTDGWTTTVPEKTAADTYYVWYYVEGADNYKDTDVQLLGSKSINKASATTEPSTTMTTGVTAKKDGDDNQTYTGDALDLVNAGESKAGTLKYKVTTTNEQPAKDSGGWSESVPTETNAGTYYVWYYAEGNNNYEETAVSATPIEVTIGQKEISVSGITANDKTYDGNTSATLCLSNPIFTGLISGDELSITATGTFADANAATDKAVSISNITLGGASADNYKLAESGQQESATANITALEATLNWTNTTFSYDGSEHTPTCTVGNLVSGDECTVTVTGGQTNAGSSYTATASALNNSNYRLPAANTTTFSISNATMTGITATSYSAAYDGTAHGITVNGVPAEATVKYGTTEGTYNLDASPTYTDAGDAKTVYYQVSKTNYDSFTGSATVTIAKAECTVSLDKTSVTVTGSSTTQTVTVTCDGDGTVTAISSNTSVAIVSISGNTVTITGVANGIATITIKVSEGTNYNAYTSDKTIDVTASGFPTTLAELKTWVNAGNTATTYYGYYVDANGNISKSATDAIGRVAYYQNSAVDTYSSASGTRILVLAVSNVGAQIKWKSSSTSGESEYNDNSAMNGLAFCANHNSDTYPAAKQCYNWSTSKPTDSTNWFLPSRGQWDKMFSVAKQSGTGKISAGTYWSATEMANSSVNAYSYNFSLGFWSNPTKETPSNVRACFAY